MHPKRFAGDARSAVTTFACPSRPFNMLEKNAVHLKLFFATAVMTFQQFVAGGVFGFSSVLLPQLQRPDSLIRVDADQASWIASLPLLLCPVGSLLSGYLSDRFGRTYALQMTYVPLFLSWSLLSNAQTLQHIYIGRLLAGLSIGTGGVIYMYIAETSPTSSRPFYLLMFTLNVGMGMMAVAALGALLDWRAVAAVFGVSSVAGFAAPFLVPATPMWLRSRGRDEDARRAELWFGFALPRVDRAVAAAMPPPPACPSAAIATLGRADSTVEAATERLRAASEPGGRGWAAYARPTVWKPALVALAFFCCQQASGFYVLLFYSVDVLRDCRVPVDGMTAAVYLSAARLAGTAASMAFQAAPKRALTAVSGLGMCAALSAAIVYYQYAAASGQPSAQGPSTGAAAAADYLMLAPFLLYVFFAMLAVLPLPWSVCGEMFPMAVKGTMNGVLYSCGYELMFAAIKSYPLLVATFGVRPVWTAFAGSCFVTAAFGAFVLPETTGKTLEEITAGFEPRPVAAVVNKHARPRP